MILFLWAAVQGFSPQKNRTGFFTLLIPGWSSELGKCL